MSPRVDLYTRQGCHLCDDALDVLTRYGIRPRLIDVDLDPELRRQFGNCVPVVAINGRTRFRGRINEVLLRRILAREQKSDES